MFILLGNKHELEASGRSELQEVGELGGGTFQKVNHHCSTALV